MTSLEAKTAHKMKEVEILYEEVDGGFARNARDRSDYLNHYERMSNLTEASIINFKDQLMEQKQKVEKLSTCLLSIVNEEEAAAALGVYSGMQSPQYFDEGTIRVTIPHTGDQSVQQHEASLALLESHNMGMTTPVHTNMGVSGGLTHPVYQHQPELTTNAFQPAPMML